ncbi:MAG: protein kinase, partial [Actinobacteria bacterium]|nr:protein kinase [Actinomycetota bacterium]
LADGEDLAQRLTRGPISVDDALPIALQIAEALEAAHEKGIIHRDLKPSNVMVGSDGGVKVLDFGLAKVWEPEASETDLTKSPTLTEQMTQAGVILGTAAYMSPEQARGKPVDKRADIWAFGVLLYEMLTGQQSYSGKTITDIIAAVVTRDPDWEALPPQTPSQIHRLLARCAQKEPRERLHDIADARIEIEEAITAPDSRLAEVTPPKAQRRAFLLVTAVVAAASLGLATWSLTRLAWKAQQPLSRFVIGPPASQPLHLTVAHTDLAVSPDGRTIVYTGLQDGDRHLFVRSLEELEATPLRGTERGVSPFFSPDGQWVGFYDQSSLKKVRIEGGSVVTICDAADGVEGASWASNDSIVFAKGTLGTGLFRVSAGGGEPEVLTSPVAERREVLHVRPDVLPGGRGVLFMAFSGDRESLAGGRIPVSGGRIPVSEGRVAVLDLETGMYKTLVQEGSNPRYSPTGHLLYGVKGTLRAAAFDLQRLELTGDSFPIVEGILSKVSGAVNFAFSSDGTLAYVPGAQEELGANLALVWIDRDGQRETIPATLGASPSPRVSPDGGRIAFEVQDATGSDVFVLDLARDTFRRLTFDRAFDSSPLWTPDGHGLVFSSTRDGARNLYFKAADGTGNVERLTMSTNEQIAHSWFADRMTLVLNERDAERETWNVLTLPLEGERVPERVLDSEFDELSPQVSPNGRWIAYSSNESGRSEIYVRPLPNVQTGRWQVSTDGGMLPMWSPNGRELFYRALVQARYAPFATAGDMMVVNIENAPTFTHGRPEILFETQGLAGRRGSSYDVSPDGERFLMVSRSEGRSLPIHLVLNWFEELNHRVPGN